MAGESVSTQAAPTPTAPKVPGTLNQPVGQGWDATAIDALNKLNFQSSQFLAGDQETLANQAANYNRTLAGLGETEGKGFKALRSRNFASGLMNSGFALGNREELASGYTNRRGALEERQQQAYNRIGAGIQKKEGEVGLQAGEIGKANQTRAEKAAAQRALEAKQGAAGAGTPGGAYPAATATVAAAFPGGTQEQREYIKWRAAGGKGNAPGVLTPGGFAQRAKGGPVAAGHAYLVGEAGPELVVPRVGGRVIPNNRLAAIRKAARGRR